MKGPGLFSDIGKRAKDLLSRDYSYDQKLAFCSVTTWGVAMPESLIATSVKKGASVVKKEVLVDVDVDTHIVAQVYSTLILSEILPNTNFIALAKFPDYNNSGKLEVQYFHHHAGLAASVRLNQSSPVVELSSVLGVQDVVFGAEAGYNTYTGDFTKYNAGIGISRPKYDLSIILADKGDTIKTAYVHHFDDKRKSSAVAEFICKFSTNESTFTVGGLYSIGSRTTVKTRWNNSGKLAALLQREVKPNSFLTISGEFDTKRPDMSPRFGLALAVKP